MRMSERFAPRRLVIAAAALLCALVLCFPFLWMMKTAMESSESLTAFPPALLPDGLGGEAFRQVVFDTRLPLWLLNSVLVAGVSSALALAFGVPAAYGLSRFRFRGRSGLNLVILSTQMMPPIVLIIPLYTVFIALGIADSLMSVIIANAAFALPVTVWMMKSVFDTIPFEVDEAARIDGASWFYISTRIVLPLALPGLVASGIFAFLNAWDEYMLARTLLRSADHWVGTVGLSSLMGEYVTPWNQIMAAALIFTIPPVLLFLCVQRYFVAGLGAGAVKG